MTERSVFMPVTRYSLKQADGSFIERYWQPSNHPVLGPAGELLYIVHRTEDITEHQAAGVALTAANERIVQQQVEARLREAHHKERIAALEQADERKDQFLGILSHELRTPINAIVGFGSILEDGLAGVLPPQQAGYVAKILVASERLLGLVNDLLDLSRVQAGKLSVDAQPFQLAEGMEAVLSGLTEVATAKPIRLSASLAPGLPRVFANPQRTHQILINLVDNAIKFTAEGGSIDMRRGDCLL